MTIEKENKTALKEAFDAELLKQLEENPPEIPSYEKFSSMIDGEVKKRRRRTRLISTAASITLLFLAGMATFSYFAPDIQADKNPKEEIITEDGVIIEDGGWGSSDGEDNVWSTTEWKYVKDAGDAIPELMIPNYIPSEYNFKSLRVENYDTGTFASEYQFLTGKGVLLEIEQFHTIGGESSISVGGQVKQLTCSKGMIYVQELEKNIKKIATIQIDDGTTVHIIGTVNDREIIKIVETLSY